MLCIGTFASSLLLAGCSEKEKPAAKYDYPDKKEVLSVCIEKTEYFKDRVEVTFSEDAIKKAERVRCLDENFKEIAFEAEFSIKDDVLTVYSDTADDISGLDIAALFCAVFRSSVKYTD